MKVRDLEAGDSFKELVLDKNKVLVDFNADWCVYCKMVEPILEEVTKELKLDTVSINVDDFPEIAREYGVRFLPNFVLFEKGKVVNTVSGGIEKEDLIKFINNEK